MKKKTVDFSAELFFNAKKQKEADKVIAKMGKRYGIIAVVRPGYVGIEGIDMHSTATIISRILKVVE